MTITNILKQLGLRQLKIGCNLKMYTNKEYNDDFEGDRAEITEKPPCGDFVFKDSRDQILEFNGNRLEKMYYSPVDGREGFLHEFIQDYNKMIPPDKRWLEQVCLEKGIHIGGMK